MVGQLAPDAGQRVDTTALSGPEGTPVLRNRLETTNGERTEQLGLARPGAKTFWGLLTRTAATILAQTLQLLRAV